jgi:hypothetical protein
MPLVVQNIFKEAIIDSVTRRAVFVNSELNDLFVVNSVMRG